MERGKRISLACVGVALLAGVLVWASRPREPVYEGKRITEWISELGDAQPDDGHPAWEAIRVIGPKAVPYLLSTIERSFDESKTYLWIRSVSPDFVRGQLPLSTVPIGAQNLRWKAFHALQILGPDAREAVPQLVVWLRHHDRLVTDKTKAALGRESSDPVAGAVVTGGYQAASDGVRDQAADTLGKIGPDAIVALPSLMDSLKDTSAEVRVRAAVAIGSLGQDAVQANDALIAALNDPEVRVRVYAARSLATLGQISQQARPALLSLLTQTNRFACSAASVALWQMDPAASESRARVMGCLQSRDHCIPTLYLLRKAGSPSRQFLPLITNLLTNEDWKVRYFATNTMKSIAPEAAAKAGVK